MRFPWALAGLERGGFRPGMTIAINGGAGLIGSGAALLAMAMGASEVQLYGRRETVMREITGLFPGKIVAGDPASETPIDMVLDCAGGDHTRTTEVLIRRLRRYGTAAFVGAITAPLSIDASVLMRNGNALIGSFWFTPDILQRLIGLPTSGKLDLSPFRPMVFSLDGIEIAMAASVETSGGLCHVALCP